jgi:hypothetical protein
MVEAATRTQQAAKSKVPLPGHRGRRAAKNCARENRDWVSRCAVELKRTDGFSTGQRFFCAAFALLIAGKERADLDCEIDRTIDAETTKPGTAGGGGRVRTEKYVAGYFAPDEKKNHDKRFHEAVVLLFHEGFTREQLHRFAAQAEEN